LRNGSDDHALVVEQGRLQSVRELLIAAFLNRALRRVDGFRHGQGL
jgi:hypothetical protein